MVDKKSYMFVTGPDVVRTVTHEEVTHEELGGAAVHAGVSGVCHVASEGEPDVVQLNQFSAGIGSFDTPTVLVAHSDVLSWFSETRGAPAGPEWRSYAGRVRSSLHRVTSVVSPTEYQSRLLQRHYGRAADRVIHNGVAPPAPPASAEPENLVLCAARAWDAAKGVETLNAAASRLGPDAPPIHLLGSTTSPQGECVGAPHLLCHGPVDREVVDAWMGRAAVYVAPSLYEPFGLAPLEAALHGCALVLSDIGSLRELWDGCAAFFPAGDAEALGETLTSLLDGPALLARRRKAARRRAGAPTSAARTGGPWSAPRRSSRSGHADFGSRRCPCTWGSRSRSRAGSTRSPSLAHGGS